MIVCLVVHWICCARNLFLSAIFDDKKEVAFAILSRLYASHFHLLSISLLLLYPSATRKCTYTRTSDTRCLDPRTLERACLGDIDKKSTPIEKTSHPKVPFFLYFGCVWSTWLKKTKKIFYYCPIMYELIIIYNFHANFSKFSKHYQSYLIHLCLILWYF